MTATLGVHSGIHEAGLRIPDDISLVSLPDTWFARHLTPPLTVVTLPYAEVGARAVSVLIDQIREPSTGETIVTEPAPRLLERGSVRRLA